MPRVKKAVETADPKAKATRKTVTEKKKKDPSAPKRGLSAYMFFANEMRPNVREENPNITFTQMGKHLGGLWKALSKDDRSQYEMRAAADRERYETEMADYSARGS